ncbi:MerC mercury resistance protein [Alteromonadaceae bacterium Bs31]|nr:MerC mercury resistance protein [Alteromonadaceae bacterium Bs31]
MIKISYFSDKAAIALSLLCTLHCLALPLLLVLLPSMASLNLDTEAFHFWMFLVVFPTSIYALSLGCKKHKRVHLLAVGACGLVFLLLAVSLEPILGLAGEKLFTLVGATLIAYGHFRNYRLCQHDENCACSEHEAPE